MHAFLASSFTAFAVLFLFSSPLLAAESEMPASGSETPSTEAPKIRAKRSKSSGDGGSGLLQPDVSVIDAPTTAVLDYGGYSANSRFFAGGGLLQYISFGVFQGLNLGGSLTVDGLVGNERHVRVRHPAVQIKWRFYDGDRSLPSLALGFDAQGWLYSQQDKRYNQRQRGFYVVATQELGLPGFQAHPSIHISDFDSNSFGGAIPLSYNIKDKVSLHLEWDNINNFLDSRLNSGVRVYVTQRFHLDFAVRGIGQGGHFADGTPRGPERIVGIRYSGNF